MECPERISKKLISSNGFWSMSSIDRLLSDAALQTGVIFFLTDVFSCRSCLLSGLRIELTFTALSFVLVLPFFLLSRL